MAMMEGRNAVVCGVANKRSIAWAIAQSLSEAGANLAITYQNERVKLEAQDLISALPRAEAFPCDVSVDAEITNLQSELKKRYERIDTLVHSIAFAPPADLAGEFIDTSREGFRIAHDVSVYSLIALCRTIAPLMTAGGSVITLTYLGSARVVPEYKVMGVAKAALEATVRGLAADLGPKNIRVNAISAGPIRTLAARGIPRFGELHKFHAESSPLHRTMEAKDAANTALFLASDLSSAITGSTIFADLGFNIMGI
jgi:enoyl-[acyl-carrier protein] reductase I